VAEFRFRLQILLDQKLQIKKQAEEELAKRQTELASEQSVLADLRRREETLVQKVRDARWELAHVSSISGQELISYAANVDLTVQDVESARDAVFAQEVVIDDFREKVEQAQVHLANSSREAEILTKYRDKLEGRFLRQMAQKEELELDEIGNMLYMSRRIEQ
jgi:flagellar protein FliJ